MSKFENKNNEEVPKDFFIKFGEKMKDKILEEEIFNVEDFPLLHSIKKEEDFHTPESYFEKINYRNYIKVRKSKLLVPVISIAASLLIISSIFLFKQQSKVSNEVFAMNDETQFELLVQESIFSDDIEIEELDFLFESSNSEMDLTEFDTDVIINYLLEESELYDLALVY